MPELPEVAAHAERLSDLRGRTLQRVEPLSFAALKTAVPPVDAAVGEVLRGVGHRGKLLVLDWGPTSHVVHLMQGGRLRPDPKRAARPRSGLLRWVLDDGALLLTEAGTERRAGVWAVEGDPTEQPPLDGLGPEADVVARAPDALRQRLAQRGGRLHTALRDQQVVAGLGRRLANEVCHRAGVSPFARADGLDDDAAARVAGAVTDLVAEGLEFERARDDMSASAQRPAAVHRRAGEACAVCGDVVRAVSYRDYEVDYCAACQTDGRVLADNTTSRFLR